MHEVCRYGGKREAITLCLATPEHRELSRETLYKLRQVLGIKGRFISLDIEGCKIPDILRSKATPPETLSDAEAVQAYSALRHYMGTITDARILIGGQLAGFKGTMPGIIEEAILTIEKGQPLYVSAGFGGAAALVAQRLGIDDLSWAPSDFPEHQDKRIEPALGRLDKAVMFSSWRADSFGLDMRALHQLAASHRASEIASLAVLGLSRIGKHPAPPDAVGVGPKSALSDCDP